MVLKVSALVALAGVMLMLHHYQLDLVSGLIVLLISGRALLYNRAA